MQGLIVQMKINQIHDNSFGKHVAAAPPKAKCHSNVLYQIWWRLEEIGRSGQFGFYTLVQYALDQRISGNRFV